MSCSHCSHPTLKSINAADVVFSNVSGALMDFTVKFETVRVFVDILEGVGTPIEVIIDCPAFETKQVRSDCKRREVTLSPEGKTVTLCLNYERMETLIIESLSDTDGDDVTSNVENGSSRFDKDNGDFIAANRNSCTMVSSSYHMEAENHSINSGCHEKEVESDEKCLRLI